MNNNQNNNLNHNLNNVENYKVELTMVESELFLKYIDLIHELIEYCVTSFVIQKSRYLQYILIKGIKNVFYILNFLLLYTKNVELSFFHTQKAILYFIEFIGQIGDDTHNFLKLASLFIYKKTIFEVNNDFRKLYEESDETKRKMELLHLYIKTYNNIIMKMIENYDFKINTLEDFQHITVSHLYKIVKSLIHIPSTFNNNTTNKDNTHNTDIKMKLIEYNIFINNINDCYSKTFISKNYLYLIDYTIKKGYKHKIENNIIKKKLELPYIEDKLLGMSVCKIFNKLIN